MGSQLLLKSQRQTGIQFGLIRSQFLERAATASDSYDSILPNFYFVNAGFRGHQLVKEGAKEVLEGAFSTLVDGDFRFDCFQCFTDLHLLILWRDRYLLTVDNIPVQCWVRRSRVESFQPHCLEQVGDEPRIIAFEIFDPQRC